jgi:hypothetical protein
MAVNAAKRKITSKALLAIWSLFTREVRNEDAMANNKHIPVTIVTKPPERKPLKNNARAKNSQNSKTAS